MFYIVEAVWQEDQDRVVAARVGTYFRGMSLAFEVRVAAANQKAAIRGLKEKIELHIEGDQYDQEEDVECMELLSHILSEENL